MKNCCNTIGALTTASALMAGSALAVTSTHSSGLTASPIEVEYLIHGCYTSEYLFRGVDLADSLVETGLDASTEVAGFGLSAGVWSAAFDSPAPEDVNAETDFYGAVSKDFGFLTASVGYIYYWSLGSQGIDNQEISFAVSRDFGFAKGSLTYFWDVDSTYGGDTDGYTELALSRAWELSPCLTLNVGTNVGLLTESSDFTAWTTKASLDWGFVENAKLSPFIALAIALGDSPNTSWAQTDNEFIAGTVLSVSF
jgi:uncharacterized protein (TIGR02001 family)